MVLRVNSLGTSNLEPAITCHDPIRGAVTKRGSMPMIKNKKILMMLAEGGANPTYRPHRMRTSETRRRTPRP